jgi:flagellar FliL protein
MAKAKKDAAPKDDLQVEGAQKSSNKLIIIVAAALLGVGIGAIGVYFMVGGSEPGEAASAEPEVAPTIYEKVEKPFIVNFQAKGKDRYLQIDVTFKGKDQKAMDLLAKHAPVIKNDLNQLFSSQKLEELQTDEGRQALVKEATKVVQAFLEKETGSPGIDMVLFTNFVMQ